MIFMEVPYDFSKHPHGIIGGRSCYFSDDVAARPVGRPAVRWTSNSVNTTAVWDAGNGGIGNTQPVQLFYVCATRNAFQC